MQELSAPRPVTKLDRIRSWANTPLHAAIICIVVLVLAGAGYAHYEWKRSEQAVQAVSKAAWLAKSEIAQRLQRFETKNGRLARTNLELQLPLPSDPSWAPLSVVEYRADGSIYFEYPDTGSGSDSDPGLLWRLRDSADGHAGSCSARNIPSEALAQAGLSCDTRNISAILPLIPRTAAVVAAEAKAAAAKPEFMHLDVKRDIVSADHVLNAIGNDDPVALEKLKAEGVDMCSPTPEGRLPLAEASRNGHLKALDFLIDASCDLQQIEPFSQSTALTSAVSIKHTAAVDLLLAAKADPNFAVSGKPTAWQLLGDAEDPTTMKIRDSLHAHGASLDVVDNNGQTLLMRAVNQNSIELVRWLTAKGANLNVQDEKGQTAVIHAVLNPQGDTALKFLISGKANLNIRDAQDYTALGHVMAMTDAKRQKELKHMLTQAGARG